MAEDRDPAQQTEEPTGRRLEKAHEQGDQVSSTEVQTFILLFGGTLTIAFFGRSASLDLLKLFRVFLESPGQLAVDGGALIELMRVTFSRAAIIIAPIIILLMIFGLAGNMVQNRPSFKPDKIKVDFSKLSLWNGLKRMFGIDGLTNLLKGLLKIAVVGLAIWLQVWPDRLGLELVLDQSPAAVAGDMTKLLFEMMRAALSAIAVLAVADYVLQRHEFLKRNRMSKQDIKDEMKETDGDPQIKARIRQIRIERSKRRMIAQVPKATVVITNPTHFAVALQYEQGVTPAPVCVAKGADALAFRIREIAKQHKVPIVENPPLARALFASVEVDGTIPPEHYKAVAQVIGYVLRLTGKMKAN
jgi:flagellar biosynthesis protein FlhB